jgi:cupin fold WbuC family metalloprotein
MILTDSCSDWSTFLDLESKTTNTFRVKPDARPCAFDLEELASFLQEYAHKTSLSQARICMHESDQSTNQFMLIFHAISHHMRIHRHLDKTEFILIVRGKLAINFYDSDLRSTREILLSPHPLGVYKLCVVPAGSIHSVSILEDAVFVESSSGPFLPSMSEFLQ